MNLKTVRPQKHYRYRTNCVTSTADAINKMTAAAKDVSYETFVKHCHGFREWRAQLGYHDLPSQGLTIKDDWHVSYHKSKYNGVACYYLVHSAIEYIWTLGGE
jgi:hypothetical protein